jgi:hypothetical protein
MMIDTQITRPAVHHPEMDARCRARPLGASQISAKSFPRYLLDTAGGCCSISAILQPRKNTPSQYPFDTPTPPARYPADTHLLKSQDDVETAANTCGAKPSKRSEARAGLQFDRSKSVKQPSSNLQKAPQKILAVSLAFPSESHDPTCLPRASDRPASEDLRNVLRALSAGPVLRRPFTKATTTRGGRRGRGWQDLSRLSAHHAQRGGPGEGT